MITPIPSPQLRAAIVMLALAVVFCLALPMAGDGEAGLTAALVCCFVLAATLSGFIFRGPRATIVAGHEFTSRVAFAWAPTPVARPPDVYAIGSLLI